MDVKKYLRWAIEKKKVKQVASLYLSMVFGIIFGILVSMINTRLLGPKQYGELKFLQNLFSFVVIFLPFGVFVTGSRLLALKENESKKHQLFGSLLFLAGIMSIVLIVILFLFSYYENNIFHNGLGRIIRICSPLLFVFPFQLYLQNVLKGDNRIYELSFFQVTPKILYIIGAMAFNYFFSFTLLMALYIQLIVLAIVLLSITIRLKVKFNNLKENLYKIWQENKVYGFHDYIGTIVGTASSSLGGITIGYFIDTTSVGYFSLSVTIAAPLILIPNAIGNTFFKDFANKNKIPNRLTYLTLGLSLAALIFLIAVIKQVVILLYSKDYLPVISLTYVIAGGNIFYGLGDYINRFMGAHGRGKDLRNTAISIGVFNVIGYFVLVYAFGIKGAAITKALSGIVYFVIMGYYYKRYVRTIKPILKF